MKKTRQRTAEAPAKPASVKKVAKAAARSPATPAKKTAPGGAAAKTAKAKSGGAATRARSGTSTVRPPAPAPGSESRAQQVDAIFRIGSLLEALSVGNYSERIDIDSFDSAEHRHLAMLANRVADRATEELNIARDRNRSLHEGVNEAVAAIERVLEGGEITPTTGIDEPQPALAPLVSGLDQFFAMLRSAAFELRNVMRQVSVSSSEVLAAATQQESSMSEHASAVHETTATMAELHGAARQIADNAGTVAAAAEQTLESARSGETSIVDVLASLSAMNENAREIHEAMVRLARRVERIGSVVEVIDEIADRSDLLALNAALEGAKAGEAGKGFSIVAVEMRRLAENVFASTKEIKGLIGEVQEAADAASQATNRNRHSAEEVEKQGQAAMGSVQKILAAGQETHDASRVIHLATQQQRTATEQVVTSMKEVETATRQATDGARQSAAAAAELAQLADRLSTLIKQFNVEG